ncbi:MAG: hypothetical protein DRR16_17180 [Candidatus Parabeggiatoa sp. nov. 3]|nr:MAG: hypothetical protein DRR00_25235 [Gammaproteobacteria bacterium]RKZ60502.1 MAG: hypothetical protein DRQ99_21980 [Gammaproteobacteria bacterium]RKZ83491.1 MAG: hypothetical protein DRR16_17180 [Gammaproteobacteria bacterium]
MSQPRIEPKREPTVCLLQMICVHRLVQESENIETPSANGRIPKKRSFCCPLFVPNLFWQPQVATWGYSHFQAKISRSEILA